VRTSCPRAVAAVGTGQSVCFLHFSLANSRREKCEKKWFLGFFSSIARLPRESAIDCQISIYSVPTGSQNIIRRVLNFKIFFFLIINISYLHFSQFPLPMVGTSELVYLGE
jgi:hypothetical protein